MSFAAVAGRRRAVAFPLWLAAAALVALAVLNQVRFGMMADVAWLVDCDERWLAGAIPYRDFLEINPPASLLLYWPAVALARVTGLPSEFMVSAFGFLCAAAALGLSAAILRDGPRVGPGAALTALVALVLLPGETFCERDHLAAVLGAPLLALTLARTDKRAVPLGLALLAGVGAGAMAAIKPPYALIGILLAIHVWRSAGGRAVLKAPEYYAAALIGVAYLASVRPFFPYYISDVLPLGIKVYAPARENLATLLASPGALVTLLIALAAVLTGGAGRLSAGFVVAMLASFGAAAAYLIQGKGWAYQAMPMLMFATLAAGFALDAAPRRAAPLFVGATAAALAVDIVHSLGLAWVVGLAAGLAVETALRARPLALAPVALAASIGAACGFCLIERPVTPALERKLVDLGPGLKLGSVSEDMGLSFPLARRIRADWSLRTHSLFVNAALEHLLARGADVDRLRVFAERERAELVADITVRRPDALLVGPLGTRLHTDVWDDAGVQAAMAAYHLIAEEARPGYAAELWLRNDFSRKP